MRCWYKLLCSSWASLSASLQIWSSRSWLSSPWALICNGMPNWSDRWSTQFDGLACSHQNHGGRRPGKSANIEWDNLGGHKQIWDEIFWPNLVHIDAQLRRRLRMRLHLFWKIHDVVGGHDPCFIHKRVVGVLGHSSIQEIITTFEELSLGVMADARDKLWVHCFGFTMSRATE